MAKTKVLKRTPSRDRMTRSPLDGPDPDALLDRYIWLLIPLLVAVYYWFGSGSTGFYQDDEIGHYRNIRQFWGDPFSIMGNQPKPGWKILLVVPGLFGFPGVMLAHCLIAALTVVMTFKLGRSLGIRHSSVAALLLAVQPLYLQLSFRSYSEITAALFVVLALWLSARDRHVLAALCASYVFSIRQEFALVAIAMGIMHLVHRRWIPFVMLAWTPALLAVLGWLGSGNPMWLIDDMTRIGVGFDVPHKPFWHYFETSIFIFGPVALALAVTGYWSGVFPWSAARETMKREGLLFLTFTIMFGWSVFSAWDYTSFFAVFGLTMENKSPNPGHWRYVLTIAPLVALYAGRGLERLLDPATRRTAFLVLGLFTLIVLAFLSREADGLQLTASSSYLNLLLVLVVLGAAGVAAAVRGFAGAPVVVVLLLVAGVHTFATEKPRTLDSEAETVKQAAEWYIGQSTELQARPLFGNHVLFRYFADIDINDRNRDRTMRVETLSEAPAGSIVVWDSHYGNSQFGGNVPMEFFEGNQDYRLLQQIIAPDQRFGILIFEKIR